MVLQELEIPEQMEPLDNQDFKEQQEMPDNQEMQDPQVLVVLEVMAAVAEPLGPRWVEEEEILVVRVANQDLFQALMDQLRLDPSHLIYLVAAVVVVVLAEVRVAQQDIKDSQSALKDTSCGAEAAVAAEVETLETLDLQEIQEQQVILVQRELMDLQEPLETQEPQILEMPGNQHHQQHHREW